METSGFKPGLLLQTRRQLGLVRRAIRGAFYAGRRYACPCCGGNFRTLMPFGEVVRRSCVMCPRCESLERHRLIWHYLMTRTTLPTQRLKLLHFAPEPIFSRALRKMSNLDYVTADLDPRRAQFQMDICNIQFPDESFDAILCVHVLEHVPDDRQALREMQRVLKRGGWALILSPMARDGRLTDEDPSVVDPRVRQRRFGQHDHVRLYGSDFTARLAEAGFEVERLKQEDLLTPMQISQYALGDEEILVSRKPG